MMNIVTNGPDFAVASAGITAILCGGACLATQVVAIRDGELRRNPAVVLLLAVVGTAMGVLGTEFVLMAMK